MLNIITFHASLTPMDNSIVRLLLLATLLLVALGTAPASALSWQIETVDSEGIVGRYSSLALNGTGIPHISHYDGNAGDLKFAWYNDSGWQNETVDATGDVGTFSSLVIDTAGNPHVSYQAPSNGATRYAWRNATGWHIETVDALVGSGGGSTSLALDAAGNLHVGYTYFGNPYVSPEVRLAGRHRLAHHDG